MRFRSLAIVCALASAAHAQEPARARTSALAGMVRDPFGHAIKDATVSVDRTEISTITNDSGMFFLRGIPAGNSDFSVTKIGYAAVHFRIDLSPDSTLVVNIPMKVVQNLPNVDVKGEQVSAKLIRVGYYERKNLGLGSFIGPEAIEKLSWATEPSTYLRNTRGIRVGCGLKGRPHTGPDACIVRMGSAIDVQTGTMTGCTPSIYVNGSKRTGELDQVVDATDVYAIETYERRALVPSQYYPSECVVAIWTRTFADVPRLKP